jgi:hypothetical protein
MMRKLKHENIESSAARTPQGRAQLDLSTWRFSSWLSSMIRRNCTGGMWTISRDGKLVCESLACDACQPD